MKIEIVFKDGRKETFDNIASYNVTEEQFEVAQTPTEGKLFEVNPLKINRSSFKKPMKDEKQECTRQIIQEAFAEVDKHPEKYASPFYTLIPKKKWDHYKMVGDLEEYANDLGGLMADWVEQALEWAQRISNGESWETICNNGDTANWYRMIVWKDGNKRSVGGSRNGGGSDCPASCVSGYDLFSIHIVCNTVPLVVLKKQY